MDIYVVNLDRHRGRFDRLERMLGDPRLNLIRIRAVDGARLRDRPEPARPRTGALPAGRTVLTRFEIACVLSHRKAWRAFLASPAERAAFLEDDVWIGEGFADFLEDPALERLAVDVLKLETFEPRVALGRTLGEIGGRRIRRLVTYNPGAAGYVLDRRSAGRLLALSRGAPDGADTLVFNHEKYRFHGVAPLISAQVTPALVIQNHLKADAPPDPALASYIAANRGVRVRRSPLTAAKLRREIERPFRALWRAVATEPVPFR